MSAPTRIGRLTEEQVKRYEADPLGAPDVELRQQFKIPDDRYYTVSVWPERCRGFIYVDLTRTRLVKARKISKSDQPS